LTLLNKMWRMQKRKRISLKQVSKGCAERRLGMSP
jgi:hypothetical protein